MGRSKSSREWLREHFTDPYVIKAHQAGYRSRSTFKLIEMQDKYKLCRPGMTVVDLGAAPGGWSQMAVKWVGAKGRVVALDILPMDPLEGVHILQGDFEEEQVLNQLNAVLGDEKVDLVLSDMAPNMSGHKAVDQPRAVYLCELALEFAQNHLKPGGSFLVKVFQGVGSEAFIKALRQSFKQVVIKKPTASRSRSTEVYVLAREYKLN